MVDKTISTIAVKLYVRGVVKLGLQNFGGEKKNGTSYNKCDIHQLQIIKRKVGLGERH